jgi:hypothetical protein
MKFPEKNNNKNSEKIPYSEIEPRTFHIPVHCSNHYATQPG